MDAALLPVTARTLPAGRDTWTATPPTSSYRQQKPPSIPHLLQKVVGEDRVDIIHKYPVTELAWHAQGDYFASVCPAANSTAVLVHHLHTGLTQNPFRKPKGRVPCVAFHPSKPYFFVATTNDVKVYNLVKQQLAKRLVAGSGGVSSIAVHPGGDHVLVGTNDKRVLWFDLDLATTPYRVLRYHGEAVKAVAFHTHYPLFASSSDDGACHVFHGRVYDDLMTDPLIVPLKILRHHTITEHVGVQDVVFHPHQPWVFTAGADGDIFLYCN